MERMIMKGYMGLKGMSISVLREKFYKAVRLMLFLILSITIYYIISDMVGTQLVENIVPARGMLFGIKEVVLVSLISSLAFFYLINKIFSKITTWNRKTEVIVLSVYFALCMFFSYYFANSGAHGVEIGVINEVSNAIAKGSMCDPATLSFMSRYSYLRSLACFAALFSFGGIKAKSVYVCLGMVMGFFSSLEFLKMAKCTPRALFMTTVFFYTSMPLYLSCSIFYNYTVVFWMPITIILLYLKIASGDNRMGVYVFFVTISTIGVCLFSIVWVPIIAMTIDMILNKKYKMFISFITIIVLAVILNHASYNLVDKKIYNSPELKEMCKQNEIPMFDSTLYTGLNSDSIGFFTGTDLTQILSIPSYSEKKAFLKTESANRIQEKKGQLLDFVFKKSSLTFGHGTFNTEAVSNHGLLKERSVIRFFSSEYEDVGYYRSVYCAVNIILLVSTVIKILSPKKSKENDVLYLTVLGFWMVSMISETDSRHIMPCLPLLFVLAAQTIADIGDGELILLKTNDSK